MKTLPPGSVIGVLGGGQLGRMLAMSAARLGYHVHIFCTTEDEPAIEVSSFHTIAAFDDREALVRFARAVDVVTLEWENVPLAAIDSISAYVPVMPNCDVLRVAQDRGIEKSFLRNIGIGTADFEVVQNKEELCLVFDRIARPCILKSTRMGYDGKGQVTLHDDVTVDQAWRSMGSDEGIVEAFVDFDMEVSVLVARREDGAVAAYPVVQNIHRNHILFETHAPASIEPAIAEEARQIAFKVVEGLNFVGLLAIEMFVLKAPNEKGQHILVNEIAPRPHNSGHWTMDACVCSQYEQLVRSICGLPLGCTKPHSHAVMRNLLGDEAFDYRRYLEDPTACLHLYGKKEARDGRKMGHVTFIKPIKE